MGGCRGNRELGNKGGIGKGDSMCWREGSGRMKVKFESVLMCWKEGRGRVDVMFGGVDVLER